MKGSDQPKEKTVSEAAVALEDVAGIDLRQLADHLLETTRVEYVDDGVLLVMNPPSVEHRTIVGLIVEAILLAVATRATPVRWAVDSENFQWELPGQSERFFVPDIVVRDRRGGSREEERSAIALIAEVTSPTSADTVYNDRVVKPAQYAKAGVPLYLLVDQERTAWTLFGLGDRPGYQVLAAGKFGDDVPLPTPFCFSIPTAEWPG